jgi:hypothetical protein
LDSKKWWQSKAIWGGIVAAVSALGDMLVRGHLTTENITGMAGGLLAIYGRAMASTEIK